MKESIVSVSELNSCIKSYIESNNRFNKVFVTGEISNYKVYPSGHHYFSLKDSSCSLRCVLFKGNAYSLRFKPENGMEVIAVGSVSVYPRDGIYQLNCCELRPGGAGALQIAFEKLKSKLSDEGLFEVQFKKALPEYPDRIALITSPSGAAVHDMIRILNQRWPLSKVLVVPVTVQGTAAAGEISQAIQFVNDYQLSDLIITGRGGGSAEDLWAFNEEIVARAIFRSNIPVISAVGHEPDVCISDYVADKRASTPSNAAEIAVKNITDVKNYLLSLKNRITSVFTDTLNRARYSLDSYYSKIGYYGQTDRIQHYRQDVDYFHYKINILTDNLLNAQKQKISHYLECFKAYSPKSALARGFCLITKDNSLIVSSQMIKSGDSIAVEFCDGAAECSVVKVIN